MSETPAATSQAVSEIRGRLQEIARLMRQSDFLDAEARQALALDPYYYLDYYSLGRALEQNGQPAEAVAVLQKGVEIFGRDPLTVGSLGHAYAVAGRRAEAQAALAEVQAMAGKWHNTPYWLAIIHAGLGDREQALQWLDKAYADHFFLLMWLRYEPRFDPLRTDPRFDALLARIGPK